MALKEDIKMSEEQAFQIKGFYLVIKFFFSIIMYPLIWN